jgi:hypothetical protein
MKRLMLALAAGLGLAAALPGSVGADISLTQTNQVTLSCNDGHSVILDVDSTTLASLAADVQAINTSGTGTSCSLNTTTIDPSSETTEWTVYDYNPSNQELAPRNSPKKMPAATSGATTMFKFIPFTYTALLTTTDRSLTGDLSMTTLKDDITLSGNPGTTFRTQHDGGAGCASNVPAAVRFYFISPSASGSTIGTPPAGFYTRFWWSNPIYQNLSADPGSGSITADVGNPAEWSDWNGKTPLSDPTVFQAWEKAIHNVQTIGLSFGGTCFFETGVVADYAASPPPYEVFSSNFTESSTP